MIPRWVPGPVFMLLLAAAPSRAEHLCVLSDEGAALAKRPAVLPRAESVQARARALVEALLSMPRERGGPFPTGTRLRHLFLTGDGTAVVDLSAEAAKVPPGASSELLSAQALALTLSSNLPGVGKVLIMIEGRLRDTLAGHLGLLDPILPMEALVKEEQKG